jgi:putative transposase
MNSYSRPRAKRQVRCCYFGQCKTLTGLIDVRPEVLSSGVTLCRGTFKRLDRALAGFYRRVGTGENPGFPRFRTVQRWDSLQWEDRNGWNLKGDERRLRLLGIGEVKMNYHRPVAGVPKAITVKREGASGGSACAAWMCPPRRSRPPDAKWALTSAF